MGTDIFVFLFLLLQFKLINSKNREGRIVGGEFATVDEYPFAAFISVACNKETGSISWMCGGSIVNQKIILSAGHCVEGCRKNSKILVNVGDRHKLKGIQYLVKSFKLHEKYDNEMIVNDIALFRLQRDLKLGPIVSRVSLLKRTPKGERACLAGWGLINENQGTETNFLKHLKDLPVYNRKQCLDILEEVPRGAICAGRIKDHNYAAQGDSGSALIIRNFMQIGLVSHKIPELTNSVVIYTEVAYHHYWITINIAKLFCKS